MYTLVIKDTEYSLPDKVTVGKWMKIALLNDNFEEYKVNLVATMLEIPEEDSKLIPSETIDLVVSFILVMLNNTYSEDSSLNLIDFNKITFGQWIDLDVYLSEGLPKHLNKIVNILFSLDESDDVDFNEVIAGLTKYTNYRKFIYNEYKNLFGKDEESEEDETPRLNVHPAKTWQNVLTIIADDDLTKFDKILDTPVITVFNFMAHKKEKAYKAYLESQRQRQ